MDAERTEIEIELQAEETRLKMRLELERQQHNNELDRIDALSKVGIETLISVSGSEQSQMLAQLARTRSLSGCTPQQIMAMELNGNPQIAAALKEILTATANGGQLDQYERLISELKEAGRTSREANRNNISTLTEMFGKAMDSVRDTAIAFSSSNVNKNVTTSEEIYPSYTESTATLLCTDIVGYSDKAERLGDEKTQQILHIHDELVGNAMTAHGGIKVKSSGQGGFMLAFSDGSDGILCAISMQRALRDLNMSEPDGELQVRIGLHSGTMTIGADGYSGRNVIVATRIAAKAQGGQILVSSLLKEITKNSSGIGFGIESQIELKGIDCASRLYLVDW